MKSLLLLTLLKMASARVMVPLNRLYLVDAQPGRHCTEFQLGRRPSLKALPEEREGRTYVAFALRTGKDWTDDSGKRVDVFIGPEDATDDGYIFGISAKYVTITKLGIGIVAKERLGGRPRFGSGFTGFFFRVKWSNPKRGRGVVNVALYDAGEEGLEPIISYEDPNPPADLSHYGISSTFPGAAAEVDCRSTLLQPCAHSVECVTPGTLCSQDGADARCECDVALVTDVPALKCVKSDLRLGEQCLSSKQCVHLEAKCRTTYAGKVCRCLDGWMSNREGVCVEDPSGSRLDFARVGHPPTIQVKTHVWRTRQ